jgi:hypothetical protein
MICPITLVALSREKRSWEQGQSRKGRKKTKINDLPQ